MSSDPNAEEGTPLVPHENKTSNESSEKKKRETSAVRRTIALITDAISRHQEKDEESGLKALDKDDDDVKQDGLGAILKTLEESDRRSTLSAFLALVGIVCHVVGGAFMISLLEGWSFYDSLYFSIVTTTTVGYGDITPKRDLSKIFVMFYVIVSIGLISSLLAYMVGVLLDQQEEVILERVLKVDGGEDQHGQNNPHANSSLRERILDRTDGLNVGDYYGLCVSTLWLVGVLAVGVAVFMGLENLSFLNALYATIISASTVGFGDFEPTRFITKTVMTIWLVFSTIGVVKVIADYTDASVKFKQRAVTRRLLSAQLDMKTWKKMDKDNDGAVNKSEFITEFLVRSGKVQQDEMDAILARFDELDKDKNGDIRLSEIIAV